jgi:hypothetical protein
MSWEVYGTITESHPGNVASFSVTGGFLNATRRLLEVFLKLLSFLKKQTKTLSRKNI